ncbi:uncharacterized protein [Amphiura filiformis]|uniref:uncharacterized protein n=1 Tax=Amphiura filiformis TaxID=82378 RepID=UPI003B20B811
MIANIVVDIIWYNMHRLGNDVLAVLLLTCILQDRITCVEANNCVVGQGNDHGHIWRWVLHDDDPCSCTSVTFGGANLMTTMQTSKQDYVEEPMATSEYVTMFMKLYDLDCMNLTCPVPKVVKTDPGKAMAMVQWLDPVPTDSTDYVYKATCYPPSGTNFTVGNTSVVCSAVDRRGISKTCHFDIKVEDNCLHQLGMEDKRIENGQITASSVWISTPYWNTSPQNARLNHQETFEVIAGSWVAANNVNQWIQVNLRAIMWVSGVMLQGRNSARYFQWVTKFKVAYNIYGSEWKHIKTADNQEVLVFDGNTDSDTIVLRRFPSPVRASVIRIQPMEWHGHISMRFDLIGCEDPEWQLVFKAVSGIASAPMDGNGFDEYNPLKVWQRNEPLNEDIPQARQLNTSFRGHYKSSFAVDWETRNIDKIMVVMLDHTGMELVTLLFNGTGSNRLDWFSKDRLLSSPYDDIFSETQNYFSVEGYPVSRQWFISRNYGSCSVDSGWIVVGYDFTPGCDWERRNVPKPNFLYSLRRTYTTWDNVPDIHPLGLENEFIKASQITASSSYSDALYKSSPDYGRLNNNAVWTSANNDENTIHWLQVDFLTLAGITAIRTQGAPVQARWVTHLSVMTGNDEMSLAPIMETGEEKMFPANVNRNDVVDIEFPVMIFARLLRVIPKAWKNLPALRMEVMGYYIPVKPQPLGMEHGTITDDQLTASSYYMYGGGGGTLPKYGRLNNNAFWAASTNNNNVHQWLQIEFNTNVGMTGIRTQGAGSLDQWVAQLSIKTGNNENTLTSVIESGTEKIFAANLEKNAVVDIKFPVTIFARLLRVVPIAWNNWPAMRMEVMGYYTDVGEASIFAIFVHTTGN